jgi:hypothetical protein
VWTAPPADALNAALFATCNTRSSAARTCGGPTRLELELTRFRGHLFP